MPQRRCSSTFTLGLMTVAVLAGMALTAWPTQAQVTSNGPYYATPSWDQTLPASTRFIILSNFNGEAVLDRETGLVWQKSPLELSLTWGKARDFCLKILVAGRSAWRLPSVFELSSLIDASAAPALALPPGHPFTKIQEEAYWTATSSPIRTTDAWALSFHSLGPHGDDKNNTNAVWCVRGPMNADVY